MAIVASDLPVQWSTEFETLFLAALTRTPTPVQKSIVANPRAKAIDRCHPARLSVSRAHLERLNQTSADTAATSLMRCASSSDSACGTDVSPSTPARRPSP